jgi:homoserine O-succinyltransferase/O-acetyltransferase
MTIGDNVHILFPSAAPEPLNIGLVNIMPDAAFLATELQFADLVGNAGGRRPWHLHLFTLPEVVRDGAAAYHAAEHYRSIEQLWTTRLDGLIVTGTEPRQADLSQETYWPSLTRVIDWAQDNTTSTIFSCLAAHAAVQYLDGIRRERKPTKLTGVFACDKSLEHWTTHGMEAPLLTPHSRWGHVTEADLEAKGYQVLTRSQLTGPDLFTKSFGSTFLFLQGHPEYAADALQKEYRRDVRRYLTGERDSYPNLPVNVFKPATEAKLELMSLKAKQTRDPELLSEVSRLAKSRASSTAWSDHATQLYCNWLTFLLDNRHSTLPAAAHA